MSESGGANWMARNLAKVVGPLVRWWVPKRLGGYRQRVDAQHPERPEKLAEPRRAAVVGGGLAGFSAAYTLARRGFEVTLYEKNAHLGGKLGSWNITAPDGSEVPVSHGFHAFFRNYYNLRAFLAEVGADRSFRPIEDYLILRPNGERMSFGAMAPTPLLNMLALADTGLFKFRDIYLTPARNYMRVFMQYDVNETPQRYDDISFAAFAETAHIPEGLKLAFNNFSRAFFAHEEKLSVAELMKSFHFYYLSNDCGLVYDYPTTDYQSSMLAPIVSALEAAGVTIRTETPVQSMERFANGIAVNGDRYEHAIIATDVVGTRAIIDACPGLVVPSARNRLLKLQPGQKYAILRLWLDRDVQEKIPAFTMTDRDDLLDAVAMYHRIEDEARAWVEANGGGVIELHSYALPDGLEDPDAIRSRLLAEMLRFLPSLEGYKILFENLQVEQNFTAFHVGMNAHRPRVEDGGDRLSFAGDWVRLPFPAMLMEAACASGIVAANRALSAEGLQEAPVYAVPPRGLFAKGPPRNVLLADLGQPA